MSIGCDQQKQVFPPWSVPLPRSVCVCASQTPSRTCQLDPVNVIIIMDSPIKLVYNMNGVNNGS